jgi:hypothetical protein
LPAPPDGTSRRFNHIRALLMQMPASLVGHPIGWSLMVAICWQFPPSMPTLA